MPNPLKGEVDLAVGKDTYTLRLSINEIINVETLLDIDIHKVAEILDPATLRLGNVRVLLWAALHNRHPDVTLEDAGDIITAIGVPAVLAKLGEAIQTSFPPAAAEDKQRPSPKARRAAGSGKAS